VRAKPANVIAQCSRFVTSLKHITMRPHVPVSEVFETRISGRVVHVQYRTYKGGSRPNNPELNLARTFASEHHTDIHCIPSVIEKYGYWIKGPSRDITATSILRQRSYG
jgi:hypothetical protein